jgi:hypothetical protein
MAKFRKKQIVIDAMQLNWANWGKMCEFVGVGKLSDGKPEGCYIDEDGNSTCDSTDIIGMRIPTLEGVEVAKENDWVIKGINGEVYSCTPDIFEEFYEPVNGIGVI